MLLFSSFLQVESVDPAGIYPTRHVIQAYLSQHLSVEQPTWWNCTFDFWYEQCWRTS